MADPKFQDSPGRGTGNGMGIPSIFWLGEADGVGGGDGGEGLVKNAEFRD